MTASSPDPAPERIPRAATGLSAARRRAGFATAGVGLPLLTLALTSTVGELALGSVLLLYLLAVVVVATVGGPWPALLAAAASVLAANWFLTPPYHTFAVESPDALVELLVFAGTAGVVSVVVDLAARDRARAERSRHEADVLSAVATGPVHAVGPEQVLERVRSTFGMSRVRLVQSRAGREPVDLVDVGTSVPTDEVVRIAAGGDLQLVAEGPALFGEDRELLGRLAAAAARTYEGYRLTERATALAEADRVRSALLASVSHDLRTPLSGLKAAVSSLRQDDVTWSDQERDELLETVETSTDRLAERIANVLDMTRIHAGAVRPQTVAVGLDEVVSRALLDLPTAAVDIDVPDTLPLVVTDAALLERVVANLVDNAVRHSPADRRPSVHARLIAGHVAVSVVDHGPGVPATLWSQVVQPFQQLGTRDVGVGLGLAIVHGFCAALDVPVRPSTTPGGGLTVTLDLPVVRT